MPEPIVARNLAKRFGDRVVLDDITVSAARGDVIGVLGKNGAGKTTLLEVLLGFSPPTSGAAEVFGEPSVAMSNRTKARIGFVPQRDDLVETAAGSQQVAITAAFYRRWDESLIERLASAWEVPLGRRVATMSVGERQKLAILLALGHHPELLVLDEPVASLDPIARRGFLREILEIATGGDRTVLFSTHIVSDLERVANKVWILKDGRLAWHGDLDALKESVVRLHVRGRSALPADLGVPQAISSRIDGTHATIAVRDWRPEQAAALARRLDADLEVEPLALEDIFIELHG